MDTEAIIDIVEAAFGSDSPIAGWIDSYKGELIDSLRKYLNNINSVIHVALYDKNGTELDNDSLRINVVKNDEWYAAFLPNGTHITNKSQVPTTVAVGSKVQLSAITTPLRLHYGTMYSVKSSSIFTQGKVVATVNDSGLVTFKNKGKVTIMASPDTDDIINGILGLVNKFYEVKGTIDSDKLAGILIDYIGIDINRAVLAAILDACFAIKDIVGDTADPVQLTATAVKLISNLVLQFVYNDSITFEVVDSKPLESFDIDGANTVQEGSQIQLAITNVKPSTGDTSDITWTSSNPEIASVDPVTGTITGRDAGGSLGSISTQKCTITATSAANGISREIQLTVTGKTGKYLSDVEITGKNYLEAGQETDLTYQVFPKRVAESNNLYVTWGMVTGEDENGDTTYSWATDDAPATDGRGQIDKTGHYTVVSGGKSTVVLKAQTGYYVSNSKFYEISSKTATFEMTNGIPVENITISVDNALGVASSINKTTDVTVGDKTYKYVSVKAGTQYAGLGAQLSATVEPENASNKDLTWVVDNSFYSTDLSNETHTAKITQKAAHENADSFNVYAVSADGKIKSNEITVTVAKNTTSSNTIDKDSYSVTRGETVDATHTMKFSGFDGTYSACYKCNWYSSDENIFTVETKNNENGDATIKGVDVGTATLYCVSADGGYVDTAEVTVYPDKDYLSNIVSLCDSTVVLCTDENQEQYDQYCGSLDMAYYVLYDSPMASQDTCDTYARELLYDFYKIGGFVGILGVDILGPNKTPLSSNHVTVKVPAAGNYTNYKYDFDMQLKPANAMYNSINWTSSNPNITIDKNGIARPKSNDACSAMITCTVTDYMGTATSTNAFITFAKIPVTGVSLDTDTIEGGKIGETKTLTATVTPKGTPGIGASCTDVYWYSSDENIATVDQKGVVTFKEGGDCVITCQTYDGGIYGECHVSSDGDRTALKAAIEEYKDIDYKDYAYDYGQVFKAAYDAATDALTDDTLTQEKIDEITQNLVSAYEAMIEHPYVHVTDAKITYQTAAKPLVGGYKDAENGTIGDNNSISINLSGDKYSNYNNYNNITLTSAALPEGAMYQAVEWSVVESYKMDSSISDSSITLTPSERSNGGWAKVKIAYTDEYGRAFEKTINVTMSDKIATGFDIKESELIYYATDAETQLEYTLSGSPEFGNITWTSSNENAVKVSNDGKLTFVEKGEAVITGTTFDGGFTDKVKVAVLTDFSTLAKKQSEYNALIEEVKDSYTYTKASLDVLSAAVAEAKTMINEGKATQAEADAMLKKLNDAYDSLIPYVASEGVEIGYYEAEGVTNPNPGYFRYTGTFINGKSISLVANEQPKDSVYKSVEWTSSNSNVTVSESGVVTNNSASAQAADITCTITNEKDESYSSTVTVTFVRYGVTGISFADEKVFGAPAQTVTLSPKFELGGNISVIKDCKYVSDNKDIATVDENGVVTFITQGCATITVTAKDGGYTATIKAYTTWDTAALKAAIDEASKINPMDYEVSYANTFTAALDKANEVYANMQAPQSEIDAACDALVAATTALEGHEFIVPEINVKNGDTVIGETALIQVPEDTQKATLSLALNDGAMVKSTDIAVSDENGVKASVSGNDINITKTADKGSFNLTVKVVDEWGREYTKAYAISVINVVIPVTSLELTVDGNVVTDGKYTVSSGSKLTFSKFKGVTVGYIPTPADANAITSVDYKVDDTANFSIDKNGKITLTTIGNLNPLSSIATKVTVTVTNADGSTAMSEFTFTVTKG